MPYVIETNTDILPYYKTGDKFYCLDTLEINDEIHYRVYSYAADQIVWIPAQHLNLVENIGENDDS